IEKSSTIDKAANGHGLTSERDESLQSNGCEDELSANNLAVLLRRLSEGSAREIENLIGELDSLRNKLQSDGSRIQSDITKYSQTISRCVCSAALTAPRGRFRTASSSLIRCVTRWRGIARAFKETPRTTANRTATWHNRP